MSLCNRMFVCFPLLKKSNSSWEERVGWLQRSLPVQGPSGITWRFATNIVLLRSHTLKKIQCHMLRMLTVRPNSQLKKRFLPHFHKQWLISFGTKGLFWEAGLWLNYPDSFTEKTKSWSFYITPCSKFLIIKLIYLINLLHGTKPWNT